MLFLPLCCLFALGHFSTLPEFVCECVLVELKLKWMRVFVEDGNATWTNIVGVGEEKYKLLMGSGFVLYLMHRGVYPSC